MYKVLGADYCPYCQKVKKYLQVNEIHHQWLDTQTQEGQKIRQKLSNQYKHKTIPMIFKDDKFIGGCNQFFANLQKPKL